LGHEKTHIGEKPEAEFLGEPEAESGGRALVEKIKPTMMVEDALLNASLDLISIKDKFAPNMAIVEPNLPFIIFSINKDRRKMLKEGINLLKSDGLHPAIIDIENAMQFNNFIIKKKVKCLGSILDSLNSKSYNNYEFIIKLAKFQYTCGMYPTGKLSNELIEKFSQPMDFNNFPKNFGVVIPGKLYRGGLISNPKQLKILKDECGIKRVISLHDNLDVPTFCKLLGIEYIPAFLRNGKPDETGRKFFGNSVSEILDQKPTYIHCYFGQDRTGGVIARYRTETGWPCRLAYLEAKSYGFKDMFADLIDWFCEPSEDGPPVDTDRIRKILGNTDPYKDPEMIQELLEPTPNDMPFSNPYDHTSNHQYVTWSDTVNNITPFSITSPIPSVSHGK
jgi:hypothetical protein